MWPETLTISAAPFTTSTGYCMRSSAGLLHDTPSRWSAASLASALCLARPRPPGAEPPWRTLRKAHDLR
jgi:hypothetical protein